MSFDFSFRFGCRAALVAFALGSSSLPAAADESAADKAAADALFSDGKKLMDGGSIDEACAKFEESYRLSVRLGTLLNLATCHEKQGKSASAWAEFNEALALARKDNRKDREQYAKKHAGDLEKKLARVTFSIAGGRESASLELDGRAIGSKVWGTPLPIDPGRHALEVSAPGKKPWKKSFEIKAGSTSKIDVPELEPGGEPAATAPGPGEKPTPESHASNPPPPEPERAEKSSGPNPVAYVALGVGVVGVGLGSYFGLRTFSKKNQADDHCGSAIGQSDSKLCDQTGVDLRDQAKTAATLSTISFAIGTAGIATGVVLLLTSGHTREKAGGKALFVAPVASHRAGVLALGGTF